MAYENESEKWQDRFQYFDAYGAPNQYAYQQALRALPMMKRVRHSMNLWCLFFPLVYFVLIGCWRKSVGLLAMVLVVGFVLGLFGASNALYNGAAGGIAVVCGMAGNYARYQKVKGVGGGWNPFEGLPLLAPKKDKA